MPHILIAESETPDEREARRERAGRSSGETYAETLSQMWPGVRIARITPTDAEAQVLSAGDVARFGGVFLTGSPMHVYEDTPEVARQIAFMRAVFASRTPSFGSCAGLQVATVAAGGTVRSMPLTEAGIARRITATTSGRDHPLLAGRSAAWDAPAIHGDEVERLPDDATLLAANAVSAVQAAEIRHDGGVFWGVQYHPELALGEIAVALRHQAKDLADGGRATSRRAVDDVADRLDRLHRDEGNAALMWELGVDEEFAHEARRRREIANFIALLVKRRQAKAA